MWTDGTAVFSAVARIDDDRAKSAWPGAVAKGVVAAGRRADVGERPARSDEGAQGEQEGGFEKRTHAADPWQSAGANGSLGFLARLASSVLTGGDSCSDLSLIENAPTITAIDCHFGDGGVDGDGSA